MTQTLASPEPILAAATGFMAAKQLFAANEIGLFPALADGPLAADDIARRLDVPARSVRIVADAMVALGLLDHADGAYANAPAAAAYLAGADGLDLREFLSFWNALSYPHWRSYEESVRQAEPAELTLDDRAKSLFGGVARFNAVHAAMLCEHYDFGAHERLLDMGGMTPAFATTALDRHPSLRATYLNDADSLAQAPSHDRLELVAADALTDPLPLGFDVVLLAHVAHRYDADDNRALLRRARETVGDDGRLLLVDFFLDPTAPRGLDAMFAGEYLVIDGTVVYPEDEVRGWLDGAGWHHLQTIALPGSPRAIVARAA